MKINIIGGGPAGMYFAILTKKADAAHDITIYERNGPDDTFGWGVVFSGKTLRNLRAADEASHAEITRDFEAWDNVDVVHHDEKISIHGNSFSGIARIRLLKILQRRCDELGIPINFRTEVTDIEALRSDCDLLVGADGVNSTVRQNFAAEFRPDLSMRPNKYIWYGTNQLFHGLTLTFHESSAGVFAAHSYKFNQTTSTFIVECDPQTWAAAGFAEMSDEETRAYLADVFERDLQSHPLLSNKSNWINFLLVRNENWYYRNVVLLGDALHTAHFSIGSGTKLAMEDSIALAECFKKTTTVEEALQRFARTRKPIIEDYQAAAYESMSWFEHARDYLPLSPIELTYALMTRSGRIDRRELEKRDPEFVKEYQRRLEGSCFRAGTQVKTAAGWNSIDKVKVAELVWTHRNRLKPVLGVQAHPHVGRMIGVRVQGSVNVVWVSPEQRFLSPSPRAERGLGGEDRTRVNPTPNPSPRAGRGDVQRSFGGANPRLWRLGRELRANSTQAEKTLWNELRGQKLGIKFRRQHSLGSNYIVDFYAAGALLAVELDGSVHDSKRARWSDGIRHRQIEQGIRILRFRNERVLQDLDGVLREIKACISNPPLVGERADVESRKAENFETGDEIIVNELGDVAVIEVIQYASVNEVIHDLIVEEDHSFVTLAGVAFG